MKDLKEEKYEMKTMVSCTNMLYKLGFSAQFKASTEGLLSLTTKKLYKPEDVKIVNFYRFEGDSNPSDNAILYAIETSEGEHGTLTDAYGIYCDTDVTNFIKTVESMHKKVNRDDSV